MRRRRVALAASAIAALVVLVPARALAQEECGDAVVFTLPGVTWQDVERLEPPEIMGSLGDGAAGALSVRTNSAVTTYSSGFATIGAGTRVDGGRTTGSAVDGTEQTKGSDGVLHTGTRAAGLEEMHDLAEEAGYDAAPGALATALDERAVIAIGNSTAGLDPPSPLGEARLALLAAMDESGVVDAEATGVDVLETDPTAPFEVRSDPEAMGSALAEALVEECATVVVDPGDLIRADRASDLAGRALPDVREEAISAADDLLGEVRSELDPESDLLLVVAPTSPLWDSETHLGVAIAVGPGYEAGTLLTSASTRIDGIVSLPDVGPSVLDYFDVARPGSMLGRRFAGTSVTPDDVVGHLVHLDEEAVYAHGIVSRVSTTFVIFQVIFYALAIAVLWRRESRDIGRPVPARTLELVALAVVAFPLASYLATPLDSHDMGTPLFVAALVAIDVALAVLSTVFVRQPLDRVLALTAATIAFFVLDQLLGTQFHLNAVWGNDPINAGRFSGLGNIAFAVLGTSALMTGALLWHRFPDRKWLPAAVAALFAVTVVVDGAPQYGSDVGGVLALVPALGLTFVLLAGRRPTKRIVALSVLGAIAFLGLFLIVDLVRPEESRTHLGRLFEDVRDRGGGVFFDVIERKVRTNLRIFRTTIWTYLVPFALGLLAYLVLKPTGGWHRLAVRFPKLRAGLIGGLVLGVLGFAVNDSGIVVPAMVLSFLVPMALVFHLSLDRESS